MALQGLALVLFLSFLSFSNCRILQSSSSCSLASCPSIHECDFLVTGFNGPIYPLGANTVNRTADYLLGTSPPALTAVNPVNKPGYPSNDWSTIVLNAGDIEVQNPINGSCDALNQFYLTSQLKRPCMVARMFQPEHPIDSFYPNCFKMTIANAQLSNSSVTLNLNPGDGSTVFPEERRCVVFQTSA